MVARRRDRFVTTSVLHLMRATGLLLLAVLMLGCAACNRQKATAANNDDPEQTWGTTAEDKPSPSPGRVVNAAWYRVPPESLAKRRAGKEELTAAHNRLPLGTVVRVTNPENDKSVVVKITDRGITDRHAQIDLCREAAEQIGMISKGKTKVRLQIVHDDASAQSAGPSAP